MKKFHLIAVFFACMLTLNTTFAQGVKNIVLVHGAFADGSGWEGVYNILSKKGYNVTVVQNPLSSLEDDVAAVNRVLDKQEGPVILVGHSWGGAVITEAGNSPKVVGLVYVAAFQPDAGESTLKWATDAPPAPENGILNPDTERKMYKRAGTKVTELNGSHVIFISKPKEVAAVIETAAKEADKK